MFAGEHTQASEQLLRSTFVASTCSQHRDRQRDFPSALGRRRCRRHHVDQRFDPSVSRKVLKCANDKRTQAVWLQRVRDTQDPFPSSVLNLSKTRRPREDQVANPVAGLRRSTYERAVLAHVQDIRVWQRPADRRRCQEAKAVTAWKDSTYHRRQDDETLQAHAAIVVVNGLLPRASSRRRTP